MERIKVWTKQHKNVLKELEATGRYFAKKQYIAMELQEHAGLVLEAYDWLVKHGPDAKNRPLDVSYPVWVSLKYDAAMLASENTVMLELAVDPEIITPINIAKWGAILNYSYIPGSPQDNMRHKKLLEEYDVSDAKAYMSQFYPQIKKEISGSWSRLFDDSITMGNDLKYGTIWEIRKEWITRIIE